MAASAAAGAGAGASEQLTEDAKMFLCDEDKPVQFLRAFGAWRVYAKDEFPDVAKNFAATLVADREYEHVRTSSCSIEDTILDLTPEKHFLFSKLKGAFGFVTFVLCDGRSEPYVTYKEFERDFDVFFKNSQLLITTTEVELSAVRGHDNAAKKRLEGVYLSALDTAFLTFCAIMGISRGFGLLEQFK